MTEEQKQSADTHSFDAMDTAERAKFFLNAGDPEASEKYLLEALGHITAAIEAFGHVTVEVVIHEVKR